MLARSTTVAQWHSLTIQWWRRTGGVAVEAGAGADDTGVGSLILRIYSLS